MDFYARATNSMLSWKHDVPLPRLDAQTTIKFQTWYQFEGADRQWTAVHDASSTTTVLHGAALPLVLVTWNINALAIRPEDRVTEIVSHVISLEPAVDVIFFQEVSRPALQKILGDGRIRDSWFSSERNDEAWGGHIFTSVTLLSKARFAGSQEVAKREAFLGSVWRAEYPSLFGRDALCCDVFVPSPGGSSSYRRLRFINVHLDSLPVRPSRRPQQVAIAADFLRSAGRGLVAGDFNPVLEEDTALVEGNGLTDAWTALHPDQPGFTWGVDEKQPFPPGRLDKVAFLNLRPCNIKTIEPKVLRTLARHDTEADAELSAQSAQDMEENPPWSDHHGLVCSFIND